MSYDGPPVAAALKRAPGQQEAAMEGALRRTHIGDEAVIREVLKDAAS